MKAIFKTCETCKGAGRVKKTIFGEIFELEAQTAWSEEIGKYVELKECDCPECDGAGEIDYTEDVEDDIEYFKRKEKQNEN